MINTISVRILQSGITHQHHGLSTQLMNATSSHRYMPTIHWLLTKNS